MNKSTVSIILAAMMATSGFAVAQTTATTGTTNSAVGGVKAGEQGSPAATAATAATQKAATMPAGGSATMPAKTRSDPTKPVDASTELTPSSKDVGSMTAAERKAKRAERKAARKAKREAAMAGGTMVNKSATAGVEKTGAGDGKAKN